MGSVRLDPPRRPWGAAVLRFAVAGLTSLLAVSLAGLVVVEARPSWLAGLRNPAVPAVRPSRAAAGAPGGGGAGTGGASRSGAAGQRGAARKTATPTAAPAATGVLVGSGGAAPVLAALQPDAGRPGQQLRLTGTNLFSTDGTITVRFAGHPAPVRCPTSRRCLVTVPRLGGGSQQAPVWLNTTGGRSNALAFAYHGH